MRTYTKILNGIDNAKFPSYFSLKAKNLVEKLCRPVPSERLGMQRGATKDIKAHKWYQGKLLQNRTKNMVQFMNVCFLLVIFVFFPLYTLV